jgi:small subunit ribosomal protein S17
MQASTSRSLTLRASRGALCVRAAQSLTGKVVSTATPKTVVVEVDRFPPHPLYAKRSRKTTRYQAHDETSMAGLGDIVMLSPCPPKSKTKRFFVAEVVKKEVN